MPLKPTLSFLFLLCFGLSGLLAQIPKNPAGEYAFKPAMKDGTTFEYVLSLNENGTYFFSILRLLPKGDDYQYNEVGHWEVNKKGLIVFAPSKEIKSSTDPDLSNASARLVRKRSIWDPDGVHPYLLKFMRSSSNWINGLELFPVAR